MYAPAEWADTLTLFHLQNKYAVGVHSIMMEKLAQAGGGGGCMSICPSLFTIFTITYKVAVYAPAEMADTLYPYCLFHLCTL